MTFHSIAGDTPWTPVVIAPTLQRVNQYDRAGQGYTKNICAKPNNISWKGHKMESNFNNNINMILSEKLQRKDMKIYKLMCTYKEYFPEYHIMVYYTC